jgi:hypothetical protein
VRDTRACGSLPIHYMRGRIDAIAAADPRNFGTPGFSWHYREERVYPELIHSMNDVVINQDAAGASMPTR